MLTIFSCPGAFAGGPMEMIQRSAIESWLMLGTKPRVILLGDEKGVAEFCREKGLKHCSVSSRSGQDPDISDIFRCMMQEAGKNGICAFVRPDLMLNEDFSEAARFLEQSITGSFLASGNVRTLELIQQLSSKEDFEEAQSLIGGKDPESPENMDYFLFLAGSIPEPPSFGLDRPWGQWLIWVATREHIPIIDISGRTAVVRLVCEGEPVQFSPLTEKEIALGGGKEHFGNLLDTDYIFHNGELVKNRSMEYYERRFLHPLLALRQKILKPIQFPR